VRFRLAAALTCLLPRDSQATDADVAAKARAHEIRFDIVRSRMQGAREGLSADLVA
jgi:hypothetical protein